MRRGLAALVLGASLGMATPALAGFEVGASVPANTFSAGRLGSPADLTTDVACGMPGGPADVNLEWTATASTFADGYDVLRSAASGGPYARIAHVDRTSTVYTDEGITSSDLVEGSTLYYVVRATAALWTSETSDEAMAAVGLMCGL